MGFIGQEQCLRESTGDSCMKLELFVLKFVSNKIVSIALPLKKVGLVWILNVAKEQKEKK